MQVSPTEQGAVMAFTLMMMVILTLIGIVATETARLEERMAGGASDQNRAFQAAELALRDAEEVIYRGLNAGSGFNADCTNGLCLPATGARIWENIDWKGNIPRVYGELTGAIQITGVARQPAYLIELLPAVPGGAGNSLSDMSSGSTPFRITAVGWGGQPDTQVILQSIYIKQ